LGRDIEEGFRGFAIALALELALTEPILRIGRQTIAREFAQEGAEAFLGERIVLAHDVAIGEVVIVLRAVGRGQRRDLRAGRTRILGRIEHGAAPGRWTCRGRSDRRRCRAADLPSRRPRCSAAQFLEPVFGLLLRAPELALELLVAKLQLLDRAGELPDLRFET